MKIIILIAFNLLIINATKSQIWSGNVIDAESKMQLEFVNVGVLHKSKGTVTDVNGKFSLSLNNLSDNDTIRVSFIGYKYSDFLVSQCKKYLINSSNISIELTPKSFLINEFVVNSNKIKKIVRGNNIRTAIVAAGFQNRDLGAEMGTVLKYHKKKKGQVVSFNFNFIGNQSDSIYFRVNLYKMKNGLPSKNILKKPIYVNSISKKGVIKIDLSEENIYIKKDSFLSLELITDLGQDGLFFKSAFLKSPSYFRPTSQSEWIKSPIDLGFWAEIVYEKK